jgi:hypothetical protein
MHCTDSVEGGEPSPFPVILASSKPVFKSDRTPARVTRRVLFTGEAAAPTLSPKTVPWTASHRDAPQYHTDY